MRAKLELALLGPPLILLHGRPATSFKTHKAQALLYYLAATGRPQMRSSLAVLLWGDMPDDAARVNLSKALSEIRQVLGDYVAIDRQQAGLETHSDYWLDLDLLRAATVTPRTAAEVAQLAQAVELVRGEFLQGFEVRNAPDYEQWLLGEQERLHQRLLAALDVLAANALRQDRWNDGIAYAQRLVTLDPLHEPGQRHLMELLAGNGQRAAALQQYEKLRQLLDAELGVAPSPETQQLFAQLQAGQAPKARSQPATSGGRYNLPRPATSFIGRAKELAEIWRILTDPECRLLTLVGPGGMGKTRLAIQAAQELIDSGHARQEFGDGVYFVPLAPANDINGLAATISQAILTDLFGSGLSPQPLIDFLAEKRLLLVLDNFEHLRDAVPLLADILARAPGVTLLVTSRETVNLTEAWLYAVGGLPVAKEGVNGHAEHEQDAEPPDAVRLFVASARRKQPGFDLARHAAEVTQICRTVGGMPLAIELAAVWLNVMPPQSIAADLRRGLDLLTSRNTVMPRHRSIRVVLEESWRLLAAEEAAVFDRLAVFRGGFLPEAGMAVSGASSATLAGLVDRALTQLDGMGRFQIHELLHQFAAEKLAQDEGQRITTHSLHSRYYLDLLNQQYRMLASDRQLAAIEAVRNDFENIAAAWQWAVSRDDYAALGQALMALYEFCAIQGRFEESVALLERLASALASREDLVQHHSLYGHVLACLGDHLRRLDRGEEAMVYARHSLELVEDDLDRAFALAQLGSVEKFVGRPDDALDLLAESVALYRKLGSPVELAWALSRWAISLGDQGYRGAQQVGREAVLVSRQTGRLDIIAQNLADLAWLDTACGDYDDALTHTREALAIAEQLGSRALAAWTNENIGWTYICMGEPGHPDVLPCLQRAIAITKATGERSICAMMTSEYALTLYELGRSDQAVNVAREAATIAHAAGSHMYIGFVLAHYGGILTRTGAYAEAHQVLRESLAATYPTRIDQMILNALCYLGELLITENCEAELPARDARLRQAAALLTVVSRNPVTEYYFKDKAKRLLASLAPVYLPEDSDALSIETVVPGLLDRD